MTPSVPPARSSRESLTDAQPLPATAARGAAGRAERTGERVGERAGERIGFRSGDLSVSFSGLTGGGSSAVRHLTPNLLIAGVTHSGAADLAAALGRHPEVKLPSPRRVDHYTAMRYGRGVEASLADYDRYFATWAGQRYRLESSPVYFDGGRGLVDAVAQDLPGVRVLVLLRDPSERLWTSYRDKVARGRLPRAMSYETFVDRCLALRANGADRFEGNRHFRTLSSGFYVEYLDPWLSAFGNRARIVFAEDLDADADATVDGLYDWLDLDPAQVPYASLAGDGVLAECSTDGLETFETARAGRRIWSALPLPAALSGGRRQDGDGGGRKSRPLVPRQTDRVRARVETLYAGANRELAAVLRHRGYATLPSWLADA